MHLIQKIFLAYVILWLPAMVQAKDFTGFFNFSYNEQTGKTTLKIKELDRPFLLVSYFASGLGSNDIGFDRGKIGSQRLVKFKRYGNKIVLIESNPNFRAESNNEKERQAAEDAFASSILFTFNIENETDGIQIDITPLLIEDLNFSVQNLKDQKQGNYKNDKTRSVIIPEEMHAFPMNIEFESWLTFIGESTGDYIKNVSPNTDIISMKQHVSFVALPEAPYTPRAYHPYSGYFSMSYFDYASPINEAIEKKKILRHRLVKKTPGTAPSEAIEPLIYYVDAACPEPIKSALIEGASWWNQAFEAAGFINAFQVKELPSDAHPLDVRYNTIQWVHRSTRGWSYGSNIHDPRSGEILKGHVTLGSLRVRQDYMIAQGLLSLFKDGNKDDGPATRMALARLKQLSAHEVGHTLGLAHNFAASVNDGASVMDYPHPFVQLDPSGNIDLSKAYDDKIGIWDKRAIVYGYSTSDSENAQALNSIINETKKMGLLYISDPDARPDGSASADGHLWDNGNDPIEELERILTVRSKAISQFGINTIKEGTPISELEKIFVPLYHGARYQVEAVSKLVGGYHYEYATKGDSILRPFEIVEKKRQIEAINALTKSIDPSEINVPNHIKAILLPNAYGYEFSRESFKNETGFGFDQLAAANASIDHVFNLLLHPQRLARINNQGLFSLSEYFDHIHNTINKHSNLDLQETKISIMRQRNFIYKLIKMAQQTSKPEYAAPAYDCLIKIKSKFPVVRLDMAKEGQMIKDHYEFISRLIIKMEKMEAIEIPASVPLPAGAPIGCE